MDAAVLEFGPGCDELCSVCVDLGKFTRTAPKVAAISVIFSWMSFYIRGFFVSGIILLGTSAFPLCRAKWLHPVNKLVARALSEQNRD